MKFEPVKAIFLDVNNHGDDYLKRVMEEDVFISSILLNKMRVCHYE